MDFEIRGQCRPQGAKKLTRERVAYFELMAQRYNSREACRIVGINYRTGKKWRNGEHSPGPGKKPRPPARREVSASLHFVALCGIRRAHLYRRSIT
jgi:transposase, IS30 family